MAPPSLSSLHTYSTRCNLISNAAHTDTKEVAVSNSHLSTLEEDSDAWPLVCSVSSHACTNVTAKTWLVHYTDTQRQALQPRQHCWLGSPTWQTATRTIIAPDRYGVQLHKCSVTWQLTVDKAREVRWVNATPLVASYLIASARCTSGHQPFCTRAQLATEA